MRSKPPIQQPTASPSTTAVQDQRPVTAIHAPIGPTVWARPSTACGAHVNRFAYG